MILAPQFTIKRTNISWKFGENSISWRHFTGFCLHAVWLPYQWECRTGTLGHVIGDMSHSDWVFFCIEMKEKEKDAHIQKGFW